MTDPNNNDDDDAPSSSSSMHLPPSARLTTSMSTALSNLYSTLTCPLCSLPYTAPSTLSCDHTFCLSCISEYAANSWECPMVGCTMPITVGGPGGRGMGKRDYSDRGSGGGYGGKTGDGAGEEGRGAGGGGVGGKGGGFARTNPILEGCVTSLGRVLRVLNEAEDGWWMDSSDRKKSKSSKKKNGKKRSRKKKGSKKGGKGKRGKGRKKGGGGRGEGLEGRTSAVTFEMDADNEADEEDDGEDEEDVIYDFNPPTPTPPDDDHQNDDGDEDMDRDGDGDGDGKAKGDDGDDKDDQEEEEEGKGSIVGSDDSTTCSGVEGAAVAATGSKKEKESCSQRTTTAVLLNQDIEITTPTDDKYWCNDDDADGDDTKEQQPPSSSVAAAEAAAAPETASKSQRNALLSLESAASADASAAAAGPAANSAAAAAATRNKADVTMLPGERDSLLGGLGLGLSARSAASSASAQGGNNSGGGGKRQHYQPQLQQQRGIALTSQASAASASASRMDATALPGDRDSLLCGLDLSARSSSDNPSTNGNNHAPPPPPLGINSLSQRSTGMDVTILPGQRDSLLGGIGLSARSSNNGNKTDDDEYCTAASKQGHTDEENDMDYDQMTDGTDNTNPNHYLTSREDEDDDGGDEGDQDDAASAVGGGGGGGGEDSEATMNYSMPSPATERKSNVYRRGSASLALARSDTLNTVNTAATNGSPGRGVGDLSILEEGSCETSAANTTHTTKDTANNDESKDDGDDNDDEGQSQGQEPSQCQSILGQVNKMERQFDSALADAIRTPSPKLDTSGRSGLDQSCAIPQGDGDGEDGDGPIFGSQGLSPILVGGSQQEQAEEEEENEEDVVPRESISTISTSTVRLETQAPSPDVAPRGSDASTLQPKHQSQSQAKKDKSPANAKPASSSAITVPAVNNKRKASSKHALRDSTVASSLSSKPQVFFLTSASLLPAATVRTVRKCIKSGKFGLLGSPEDETDEQHRTAADDNSDLELPYDFESPEGTAAFLSAVESSKQIGSGMVYAISADSELAFADGYMVPRSFRYLLVVAAGLHMVDISYLTNNSSGSRRYILPPDVIANKDEGEMEGKRNKRARRGKGPSGSSTDRDLSRINPETKVPYVICGDSTALEIGVPQRSQSAKNGLLEGYVVLLFGEFDHVASSSARVGGRKRARSGSAGKVDDSKQYSRGRISILLQLCGAVVADLKDVVEAMEEKKVSSSKSSPSVACNVGNVMDVLQSTRKATNNNNIIVLVRTEATARDHKLASKFLSDHGESLGVIDAKTIPVVGAEWALDSIGAFKVKSHGDYKKP